VSNSNDLASSCDSVAAVDLGFVELSWLQMAVLGVIQGITELLPISSTAHLRVIPAILGWRDPGSAFSAAMQLASFAAVIVYFRKDIGTFGGATLRAVASQDLAC
jgi:undecaprenyl-diphosphatase